VIPTKENREIYLGGLPACGTSSGMRTILNPGQFAYSRRRLMALCVKGGETVRDVATRFGVAPATVRVGMAEHGVPPTSGIDMRKRRVVVRPSVIVDGVIHYRCTKCGAVKPFDGFAPLYNPKSACGRVSWCRKCQNARRRPKRGRAVA
jgi:hypothetical protein